MEDILSLLNFFYNLNILYEHKVLCKKIKFYDFLYFFNLHNQTNTAKIFFLY